MKDSDSMALNSYLIDKFNEKNLAFLEANEALKFLGTEFKVDERYHEG
jgi:hypothetical protein